MSLNLLLSKPYTLCWLFALLLLLVGLDGGDEVIDINIHDTYFLIGKGLLVAVAGIWLFLLGLGYWLMERLQKRLSPWLSGIHLALTLGGLVLIGLASFVLSLSENFGELISRDTMELLESQFHTTIAVIFLAQVIFILNLLLSLLRSA